MKEHLYVAFTMDCERIAAESPPGGPPDWAFSARAIRSFAERLLDAGFPPSLLVVPECAERHADLFGRLAERGADLGLHIHPQSYGDLSRTRYLGEYAREEMRDLLAEGGDRLTAAFGARPTSFRSGNFSANDALFGVLYELGFRQGSVSDPGRNAPQFAAVWVGAYPFAHWASADDRLRPGALSFLEVPLTTDPARRQPSGFPSEMRVEFGGLGGWHAPILESALRRMEDEAVPLRTVCVFTHNFIDYGDESGEYTRTLGDLIGYFRGLRDRYDVIPAVLPEIRRAYVATTGEPR